MNQIELKTLTPSFMQVGRQSPLVVSFKDERDFYDSVSFRLQLADRVVAEGAIEGRPGKESREVELLVTPHVSGSPKIELEVICGCGGVFETYMAPIGVFVDEKEMERPEQDYGTTEAFWTNRQLELVHSPDRLSLFGEEDVIQVLSSVLVKFGREQGTNDINLRVFGPEGLVETKECVSISRHHFRLANEGGKCVVYDGSAEGKRSSFGTRVNGENCIRSELAPGSDYRISLGRQELKLVMKARVFGGSFGGASGVLFTRRDSALESIAVVWREISFDDGSKLEWDGAIWTLRGAGGKAEKLAFCNEVSIEGKKYLVRPFDQEEFIHPVGRYCRKD